MGEDVNSHPAPTLHVPGHCYPGGFNLPRRDPCPGLRLQPKLAKVNLAVSLRFPFVLDAVRTTKLNFFW